MFGNVEHREYADRPESIATDLGLDGPKEKQDFDPKRGINFAPPSLHNLFGTGDHSPRWMIRNPVQAYRHWSPRLWDVLKLNPYRLYPPIYLALLFNLVLSLAIFTLVAFDHRHSFFGHKGHHDRTSYNELVDAFLSYGMMLGLAVQSALFLNPPMFDYDAEEEGNRHDEGDFSSDQAHDGGDTVRAGSVIEVDAAMEDMIDDAEDMAALEEAGEE